MGIFNGHYFYCIHNNDMDITLNKKLLLTLLLFLFTTSFFDTMIIKSLATFQRPSRRVNQMMTLTGAPFQVCFAIIR